ncbi:MAG: flagellar hook-length control protein FliK [Gammaproteobacteria bacterium]
MNIESASLSSLATSNGKVESASPPLPDGGVISEGFSSALVTQVELLSNLKTEGSLPPQAPEVTGLSLPASDVAGLPLDKVDEQDFAALLGNDLPPSYKTKDDVDHEAALVAVTDTLKYIAMGSTAVEKAAMAEQNIKDVIAMAVTSEQNTKGVITAAVSAEKNTKDVIVAAAPAEQNIKGVIAMTISAEQSTEDSVGEAEQGKNAIVIGTPVQVELMQANNKSDQQQAEGEAKIAVIEDDLGSDGEAAVIVLPAIVQVEQGESVNNLTPKSVNKESEMPFFIKSSAAGDTNPNQSVKAPVDALQSEAVFGRSFQEKQGLNLKYVESVGVGQAEKIGSDESRSINLEGEKGLPRVGADTALLNKMVVDNKTDVPSITKPLSHPEWNKDLGERIVWMSSKAIPSAEIRLNPQHLGPISVRVDVADNQATVNFSAQHAATREALEASIPKLREMMSAQQVDLVDVNISQGAMSDQGRQQSQKSAQTAEGQGHGEAGGATDGVDDIEQEIENGRAVVSNGLLSIYA